MLGNPLGRGILFGSLYLSEGAPIGFIRWALPVELRKSGVEPATIASVPESERGRVNGWMQLGMLMGRGAFGGLSLWVASVVGQAGLVPALAAAVWWSALLLVFGVPSEDPPEPGLRGRGRSATFFVALADVLTRRATWLGLAIALIAGASFEAAGGLAGTMRVDAGYEKEVIGRFFAIPVIIATAAGALCGGAASDRFGHRRILLLSLLVTAPLGATAWWGISSGARLALGLWHLGAVYFGIGLLTASSYVMPMDLTDRRLGATQFSAFMGATNLCES